MTYSRDTTTISETIDPLYTTGLLVSWVETVRSFSGTIGLRPSGNSALNSQPLRPLCKPIASAAGAHQSWPLYTAGLLSKLQLHIIQQLIKQGTSSPIQSGPC